MSVCRTLLDLTLFNIRQAPAARGSDPGPEGYIHIAAVRILSQDPDSYFNTLPCVPYVRYD